MITALINQKGGTGKSSTSIHFAYWLQQQDQKVLLIDTDAQGSSSMWCKSLGIEAIAETDPNVLAEEIPNWIEGFDRVVIDGAGGLTETTRVILYFSNMALIPCQPTALDLVSSGSAVKLIRQAQRFREDLVGATFINRAVPRTKLMSEAQTALSGIEGISHLKTVIYQRQCIADAFGQGQTVFEMGAAGEKSANEYRQLFEEVTAL